MSSNTCYTQILVRTLIMVHTISISDTNAIMNICKSTIPGWSALEDSNIRVKQLSEGLTNYLCCVEAITPVSSSHKKVLFRIFGESNGSFYEPDFERMVFRSLSEHGQHFAPSLVGEFAGGRIEEWIEGKAIGIEFLRCAVVLTEIANALVRFHKISDTPEFPVELRGSPCQLNRTRSWANHALKVKFPEDSYNAKRLSEMNLPYRIALIDQMANILCLPDANDPIDLNGFYSPCPTMMRVVFAHNDCQEHNIMRPETGDSPRSSTDSLNVCSKCVDDPVISPNAAVAPSSRPSLVSPACVHQRAHSVASPVAKIENLSEDDIFMPCHAERGTSPQGETTTQAEEEIKSEMSPFFMPPFQVEETSGTLLAPATANFIAGVPTSATPLPPCWNLISGAPCPCVAPRPPPLMTSAPPLRLIDFEYSDNNWAGYDLANLLCESMVDYTRMTEETKGFAVSPEGFPNRELRKTFVRAYLTTHRNNLPEGHKERGMSVSDEEVSRSLRTVERLTLASHLAWGFWSISRGHQLPDGDFDFMHYGLVRFKQFDAMLRMLNLKEEVKLRMSIK